MTVYVDTLQHHGWRMYGEPVPSCHMFTDSDDYEDLHRVAQSIGLKRAWFQRHASTPHYDLTRGKRAQAIAAGAVEVGRREAVQIWRAQRARSQEAAQP